METTPGRRVRRTTVLAHTLASGLAWRVLLSLLIVASPIVSAPN